MKKSMLCKSQTMDGLKTAVASVFKFILTNIHIHDMKYIFPLLYYYK